MPVSAGELMDRTYRHQRHFYDLTRKYYLLGRDRLIAELRPADGAQVLEIGCGTGRNLIAASRRYPRARFYGIDISTEMLATANQSIARGGLGGLITVAQGDATGFDPMALFRVAAFDRVYISYSLSMIPNWQSALDMAMTAVAPGGELRIVDFGGQEHLPGWFKRMLRRWLTMFHVTPRDDLEATLRARSAANGATLAFSRPYLGYAQAAVLRRA